jgi:calcium-dependent protein kinase
VAIKTIVKEKLRGGIERLEREVHTLFALDHPNIIKLYEVFEDDNYLHLVTEYCSGGELMERLILQGKYPEPEAAHLLQKVFLAVNNLHHNGICHRDLRPQSFLFASHEINAELKLINFGLSNKYCDKSENEQKSKKVRSRYYTAPEVMRGEYGVKCDIWSLGVIMYVMLSGNIPFAGDNSETVLTNIQSGRFDLRDRVWKNISPSGIDFLQKLLVVEPHDRLSAEEALVHPWLFSTSPDTPGIINQGVIESLKQYKPRNLFQTEICAIIVKYLSPCKISTLKATFMALDQGKTGYISLSELKQGLKSAGYDLNSQQIEEILRNADFKKDGRINYSEFLAATTLLDEEVLWRAFRLFDVDKSGVITEKNVQEAMKRAGRARGKEEISVMMRAAGASEAGLSYDQFKEVMLK